MRLPEVWVDLQRLSILLYRAVVLAREVVSPS